jgi:hypothetical protein
VPLPTKVQRSNLPPGTSMIAGCFSAGGSMAHGGASCGGFTIRDAAPQHIRAIAIVQVEASLAAYDGAAPPGYFDGFTIPSRVSACEMIAHLSAAQNDR